MTRTPRPASNDPSHEAGETGDLNRNLGAQIRELRKARGLTLQELAGKIGKTAGFLSQIERAHARPSIATLQQIGEALGVPFSWFASHETGGEPASESGLVVRAENRRRLRYNDAVTGAGFADDLLSPHLRGNLIVTHTRFAPGGGWGPYEANKEYDVCLFVLSGRLHVDYMGEAYVLSEGDSMQYTLTSDAPHHEVRNASDNEEARFIWVGAPVVLDF